MSKFTAKLAIIFLGLCITTTAFAIEVPLKYQKHPDKSKAFYPSSITRPEKKIERPTGKWKMPELLSEYPLYIFIKIGDEKRLCVMDRQKAEDVFYNRLYFDANGNSDLTDDAIIDGTSNQSGGQRSYVNFPIVDTSIEVDGKSLPYSFRPYVYTSRLEQLSDKKYAKRNIERYVNFWLWVNCSYLGEFQIDGQTYRIVLGDTNGNGRFSDGLTVRKLDSPPAGYTRMRIITQGDNLYITSDEKINSYDRQVLGDMLLVKDRLFKVSISAAKGKLTLTPITKNLVALKLPMKAERISLQTEDEQLCLNMYKPGKKIMVPQGKYRLISYDALKKDEQGDLWRLCATGTTDTPYFTVSGSDESVLEFGEPYAPSVIAQQRGGKTAIAYLMFNVEGKGKEFLTLLSHMSGNQTRIPLSKDRGSRDRPKEPTYKIMNAGGEVVSQGSFEYG